MIYREQKLWAQALLVFWSAVVLTLIVGFACCRAAFAEPCNPVLIVSKPNNPSGGLPTTLAGYKADWLHAEYTEGDKSISLTWERTNRGGTAFTTPPKWLQDAKGKWHPWCGWDEFFTDQLKQLACEAEPEVKAITIPTVAYDWKYSNGSCWMQGSTWTFNIKRSSALGPETAPRSEPVILPP